MRRETESGGRPAPLFLLMATLFAAYLGYGVILPVLPLLVERLAEDASRLTVSAHTGLLAGLYMLMLFLFAPLWGRASDRFGRRPVLLLGLAGCVASLVAFGLATTLWTAYLARAAGGALVAAVLPAVLAYAAEVGPLEQRARRFAWLTAASTLALVAGPALGGRLAAIDTGAWGLRLEGPVLGLGMAAAFGALVWLAVYLRLPEAAPARRMPGPAAPARSRPRLGILLVFSLLGLFGLGSFETALTLRTQQVLGLGADRLGTLFIECSLVMAAVQLVLFTPLLKRIGVRYALVLAFTVTAAGLYGLVAAVEFAALLVSTALVSGGIGLLIPLLAYAVSRAAGSAGQGRALGRQIGVASLGQGVGSASAGWIFGLLPQAPFWITATVLLGAALAAAIVRSLPDAPAVHRIRDRAGAARGAQSPTAPVEEE
ncbi:MFS transporter [Sulfurifustis variabilis]|uniref:MFS transporter n=1 Tax=Sulfurifustis variabilis TaxID=1675686 RepID=A0A1C7AEW3_9GAMM|nr:MFS transporter [Sulfurifustis variabilis]BAU49723.1 MFS transporter [Sulfurifustis variabilis]